MATATITKTTTRRLLATALVLLSAGAVIVPAARQSTATAAQCGPTAIGLSRTVEIDTTDGPRYGHQQYKDIDFLNDGEIVLTFDDGPSSINTPKVLRALEEHCTKATFFMVGSRALAEARLVKDVARRGHTIGTHTWSHANLRAAGAVRAKDEIEMGISGVQRAAGQPIAPFFRFPYLADSRAMQAHLKSRNIGMFSIDEDAYDYKTLNPAEVHKAIIAQVTAKRKGIILFHDIQPATAGAINGLLTDLKKRGFRVVHMVPAAPGTSTPSYDVIATRDASRRLMAQAANPLAKRAVTWPMAQIYPPSGYPSSTASVSSPTMTDAGPAYLPPRALAPPPPPVRRTDDSDWKKKIFGF